MASSSIAPSARCPRASCRSSSIAICKTLDLTFARRPRAGVLFWRGLLRFVLLDRRRQRRAAHEDLLSVAVAVEEVDRHSGRLLEVEVSAQRRRFECDEAMAIAGQRST